VEVRDPVGKVRVCDRVRDVVASGLACEAQVADDVATLDGTEVPLQRLLRVLGEKADSLRFAISSNEVPELVQVVDAVRRRDQPAAGPQDAGKLGETEVEIRDVVE